jgi:hypothetical protein
VAVAAVENIRGQRILCFPHGQRGFVKLRALNCIALNVRRSHDRTTRASRINVLADSMLARSIHIELHP